MLMLLLRGLRQLVIIVEESLVVIAVSSLIALQCSRLSHQTRARVSLNILNLLTILLVCLSSLHLPQGLSEKLVLKIIG